MADIDDLLRRADALPEPVDKTREDLVRDLEKAIQHAERMARTKPKEAAYRLALWHVEHLKEQLDATVGPHLRLVTDDESWQEFIDEHPELLPEPARLEFNDDDLVVAVETAIAGFNARTSPLREETDGIWSACVADELVGVTFVIGEGFTGSRPARGDVIRVGQALGRLAREGRIRRVSKSWESNRYAPLEADRAR